MNGISMTVQEAHELIEQVYDACEAILDRPIPGRADPLPTEIPALLSRLDSVNGLLQFAMAPGAHPLVVPSEVPKQVGGAPNFAPHDFPGMEIDWAMKVPSPEAPNRRTADNVKRLKQKNKAKRYK